MKIFHVFCLAAALCLPAQAREQFRVPSAPDITLSLIEVGQHRARRPILLIHGARVGAVASFDLQVPGGSLASDLAAKGFDVYLLDVRGYGSSTRPPEMNEAPDGKPALVRSNDAVADIDAAIDFIRQRSNNARVALLGWATGGQWAGHYASLHSDKLSALIMLNSLYRGSTVHAMIGRGSSLDDKGRFNTASCGAYRFSDAASVMRPWDSTLGEAKDSARDPQIAQAYVDAALYSDPTSSAREPRSFRSPCGAMEDSYYLASGRQLWDASLITAPVLAIAGERDFWSRPEDMRNLEADLTHAPTARMVRIPGATHFLHLERPERGRTRLLDEVNAIVPRER
jgi:pimeloyl-ACP methyl ester carboxylesterase